MSIIEQMQQELQELKESSNLRILPDLIHEGRDVIANGQRMLNLSSNDYLGLATDRTLREEFLKELTADSFLPTSSSSRLLTGNFTIYEELEQTIAELFGTEAALVFNSGYHANTGILPAVSDAQTLILADKLVHASLIDGIRLSTAKCIRYRHNDLKQLKRLLAENHALYRQVIIVTESIFSMDGDIADLKELVRLKHMYENVLLYVDEAHAFGARGEQGLGCAEETGCIREIDFLVGTFWQSSRISRSIYRLSAHHPGVSGEQDADTYFYNSSSSGKYRMDFVCCAAIGRIQGAKSTFKKKKYQQYSSQSFKRKRIYLSE